MLTTKRNQIRLGWCFVVFALWAVGQYAPKIDKDLDRIGGVAGGGGSSITTGPSDCLDINTTPDPDEIDLATPVTPCVVYLNSPNSQSIGVAGTAIDSTLPLALVTNTSGGSLTLTGTPTIEAPIANGQTLTICAITNNIVLQDEANLANSDIRNSGSNITIVANGTCARATAHNSEWHFTQSGGTQTFHKDLSPCGTNVTGTITHQNGWTFPSVTPATTVVGEASGQRYCGIAFDDAAPVDIAGVNVDLSSWNGTSPITIRYMFSVSSGGTNGQDIRFAFETAFVTAGDDITTTFTFNAAQARVIDLPAAGTANTTYADSFVLTTTGGVANDLMLIRITRDGADAADTLAADGRIIQMSLSW